MLQIKKGDLFVSKAQVLVNPVNLEGVMGKGLALEFKKRFPEMFEQYRKFCLKKTFAAGQLWLYKGKEKWVLNFPTKISWRDPSDLALIESGLEKFKATYESKGITSVAFPMLGCGCGGLKYADVLPLMERILGDIPIDITVYK